MVHIDSIDEFRNLSHGEIPFCAIFSADWCPDCRIIKAVLPSIEQEFKDQFAFAVVDHDAFAELSEEYGILGIPSFVVFKDGDIQDTFISSLRKTRKQITDFLKSVHAKNAS